MKTFRICAVLIVSSALGVVFPACNTRKDYPQAEIGWHSPGYSVIFGRLEKIPGSAPDVPPVWSIRYGGIDDPHRGQLALTPGERMVGYSGGENVEIRGRVFEQQTTDAFNGRWYVVDSIQMWSGHR